MDLDFSEELPKLPRVLKKKEAKVNPKIEEWLKNNWPQPYAYEVKIAGNKLKKHQGRDLNKYMAGNFAHKLSDATVGKQPFDGFGSGLSGGDALVITYYPKKREMTILTLNTGKKITVKI